MSANVRKAAAKDIAENVSKDFIVKPPKKTSAAIGEPVKSAVSASQADVKDNDRFTINRRQTPSIRPLVMRRLRARCKSAARNRLRFVTR